MIISLFIKSILIYEIFKQPWRDISIRKENQCVTYRHVYAFTFLSSVCHYTIIKEINETSHDRMFCKQKMFNGRVRGNNITPGGIRCTMA